MYELLHTSLAATTDDYGGRDQQVRQPNSISVRHVSWADVPSLHLALI
jgi:hypothetical protein